MFLQLAFVLYARMFLVSWHHPPDDKEVGAAGSCGVVQADMASRWHGVIVVT
jgi:hypothetical protein